MASVIEQTADLYNAMSKHIPSILEEDSALPRHQEDSQFSEPNRITAKTDGAPQETVRRLTEAGLEYYNNGKLEEAAKCYEEALELRADSILALYSIGAIWGHLKRYGGIKGGLRAPPSVAGKQGKRGPNAVGGSASGNRRSTVESLRDWSSRTAA